MEPKKDWRDRIEEILDKALDKGMVLNADLVITVADTPLVGINLKAALAGIETMLDYGVMEPFDESIRKYYEKKSTFQIPLLQDERVTYQVLGSLYSHNKGVYNAWRYGVIRLTNKRLVFARKCPPSVLFETELNNIKGLAVERKSRLSKVQKNLLVKVVGNDDISLHTTDIDGLKSAIAKETRLPLTT